MDRRKRKEEITDCNNFKLKSAEKKQRNTLFQTINFGIDDNTSSSDKTLSTASICCSARGWLNLTQNCIR